jgi:hypothetical protein
MKDQMNTEAGLDVEDGGVDLPPNSGVTNRPTGNTEPADNQEPEDEIGDENDK